MCMYRHHQAPRKDCRWRPNLHSKARWMRTMIMWVVKKGELVRWWRSLPYVVSVVLCVHEPRQLFWPPTVTFPVEKAHARCCRFYVPSQTAIMIHDFTKSKCRERTSRRHAVDRLAMRIPSISIIQLAVAATSSSEVNICKTKAQHLHLTSRV